MKKRRVIIDADTANEIDDLYAIAYGLLAPEFDVVALTSAHFRIHDEAPEHSVAASQVLNEELLHLAGRPDVPGIQGSNHWMGKAWGEETPADSPAVQAIIKAAKEPAEEKLALIGQGAMTNIASALKLAPEIAHSVEIYVMGFRYDTGSAVWNKNEFNVRNDLNAADFLLNQQDICLYIMPAETCSLLEFDRDRTFAQLDASIALHDCLKRRWLEHCPKHQRRIMWDLALVMAVAHPEWATVTRVATPPENQGSAVNVFTDIDGPAMWQRFWSVLG